MAGMIMGNWGCYLAQTAHDHGYGCASGALRWPTWGRLRDRWVAAERLVLVRQDTVRQDTVRLDTVRQDTVRLDIVRLGLGYAGAEPGGGRQQGLDGSLEPNRGAGIL
jgi:hypothetical protein